MNQKGLTPIVIILLIVAAIVGGILFYQKQTAQNTILNKDQSLYSGPPKTEKKLVAEQIPDNWKTFSAKDYDIYFSLKYPDDWKAVDQYGKRVIYYTAEDKKQYEIEVCAVARGIQPPPREVEQTAGEALDSNGLVILKQTWKFKDTNAVYFVDGDIAHSNSNVLCKVRFNLPENNQEKYLKIFDQILSTFKFLDQNNSISSNDVSKMSMTVDPCDFNEDGQVDKEDHSLFRAARGAKRGELGYSNSLMDGDLDGVITISDEKMCFPVTEVYIP